MNTEVLNAYPKYDSYKDSGVDWLGEVPKEWTVERLGNLLKEVSDKNYPDLPLLSITRELGVIERDIDDMDSNHNFIPDDLSGYKKIEQGQFGMNKMKAWQGSYGISRYTGIVSPAYYIFNLHPDLNKDFFSLAIRSKLYVSYFGSASDGVRIGQWDLNKTRMRQIRFVIPTLNEQEKIVRFLTKKILQVDQAIDLKQQQIERLNEYKQIIIQNAVTKGLDPTAKMKDSGVSWIGNIPEEWTIEKGKWLFFKMDRPVREEDGIVTCFRDGEVTLRSNRRTEGFTNALKEHGYQGVRKGDLVIHQMDAFAGAIGVSDSDGKSTPVYSVCIPKDSKRVLSKYYSYFLRSIAHNGYILSLAKGIRERSTDFRFNDFAKLELPLPPYSSQIKISEFIEQQTARINLVTDLQKQQIERLKEYKTILINQAVTGKIKVS